jgi:succinyl-CoA synthetase beta subunit
MMEPADRARPEVSAPRPATTPTGARAAVEQLRAAGSARLGLSDLIPLLTAYGIPVLTPRRAQSSEEAAAIAVELDGPVALKIASPDISHKTDVGGVSLGLRSPAEVARTAEAMLTQVRYRRPRRHDPGLGVQPMAPAGKELLLGVLRDAQFGPLVIVGFGGIYVEVLRDTTSRLAPLSPAEAFRMLDELRMAPLLSGVRGEPAVDRAALAETIARFGQLAADCPELVELELNPLVAHATWWLSTHARHWPSRRRGPPPRR